MTKNIVIHPYNPQWPEMFQIEADKVKQLLGMHCIQIHHIGSTSVPGLDAKEDLDILCVVDALKESLQLETMGYTYKGELNIPLRYFFSKNTEFSKVNMHVVEKDHGFIELNLGFRDFLRSNEGARDAYGQLKKEILKDPSAMEKLPGFFPKYTIRKNKFIKETLKKSGYTGITYNFCMHDAEWDAAKIFHKKYLTLQGHLKDTNEDVLNYNNQEHMVMYKGVDIVGYVHIKNAAVQFLIIEENKQGLELEKKFLEFINKWLKYRNS